MIFHQTLQSLATQTSDQLHNHKTNYEKHELQFCFTWTKKKLWVLFMFNHHVVSARNLRPQQ
ncbi:hypothetical protein Hanom_Chr11g00975161 [Helianthus anomalus]